MEHKQLIIECLLAAAGGAICASGLLMQFAVGACTASKAEHGSGTEKFVVYGIRAIAAVVSFVILLAAMRAVREAGVSLAAGVSILAGVGLTLGVGGIKIARWKAARFPR